MSEPLHTVEPTKPRWRLFRWLLAGLAVFITLLAIFYTEEDWRGKRAWEKCKSGLLAKGEELDWDKLIPPPVPDDQNFFKAPKMAQWFQGRGTNELSQLLSNSTNGFVNTKRNPITNEISARAYLDWGDQYAAEFEKIRDAVKRPYARMDGDYTVPYQIPIPNFVCVRTVAQMLGQRAHSRLLLHQPDQALAEITLVHDLCRFLDGPPTGKPLTLVAAMIHVAVIGLYAGVIDEGLRLHEWQEPQLAALQQQLADVNLPPLVESSLADERVSSIHTMENIPADKICDIMAGGKSGWWRRWKDPTYRFLKLGPRGWIYQNMATGMKLKEADTMVYDAATGTVSPKVAADMAIQVDKAFKKVTPDNYLEVMFLPNFTRAFQTTAYNQTMANESLIVCALERCRLDHGSYPRSLDMLVPQYIEKIPHDLIGGQPLHYQRKEDGTFLLYSIGWNETDDGGTDPSAKTDGPRDFARGDWIWH